MRSLLQLGTLMLLLAGFLTPVIEFFDHWDPPGPGNDTEMAVFGLILAMCLVLIVCHLTAALANLISLVIVKHLRWHRGCLLQQARIYTILIPSQGSPPLQI